MLSISSKINGYTVIVPCQGVGNVGQLALDLIVATLKMKRISSILDPSIMPIFGPPAFEHDDVSKTTACDVYIDEEKELLAIQIRAPVVQHLASKLYAQLFDYLGQQEVSKVIILTSSHAYEKHSVEASPFQYLCNSIFDEKYQSLLENSNCSNFEGSLIRGGGRAEKLLKCCSDSNIPAVIIFKYVSEGDNSLDAASLLREVHCAKSLFSGSLEQIKLVTPTSWNLLFGNDPPELIF